MDNILLNEANRCLLCKKPRCRVNCPIDTPIPDIINLYKEGKFKEAGEILFNNNPLSAVCSLVCIHEDQCKGNCIRGIKGEPISFHDIEQEISEKYLEEVKFENVPKDKDRIAIIGGGPPGITISFILARKGYNVTIFDAHVKIGGVLRYGIPEYRLPKNLIDTIIEGKNDFFECDSVIIAVSQTPRTNIVSNTTELNTNRMGTINHR